ncbi:MAG: hypothetical protein C4524_00775, partial [Candidatus Zixiibacteriota bacterium]
MKTAFTLIFLVALATAAQAYPNSMPLGYAGNPPSNNSCVNCHSSYPLNSGNGSLQIGGLPAGGYQPGTTYHLTVSLEDPGQQRWGFQLTAIYQSGSSYLQAGTLTVTQATYTALNAGTGTAPDYLRHTSTGTYPGTPGPTIWNFDWTAPVTAVGPIGFYAAGAACNNTGGTSGDYCYTTSSTVTPAGAAVPVEITLTPVGAPIQIPAGGGSFSYNANLVNASGAAQTFNAWVGQYQPSGAWQGPLLGPLNLTLPNG